MNFTEFTVLALQLGLRWRLAGILVSLQITAVFFEASGVAMLLPTIEFIQSGGDGSSIDMTINYWQWLEAAYAFIGLSIGLGPLLITSFLFISLRQVLNYCHKAYRQTVILGLARDI